jgi:threonine synthase
MRLYSTNHKSEETDFQHALIQGQAPDRGLYFPKELPELNKDQIKRLLKTNNFSDLAEILAAHFLQEEIDSKVLSEVIHKAYDFEIPLEKIDNKNFILRLDMGPTSAFKDFAARFLAGFLDHFLSKKKKKVNILVATSGDTGSAIANAFKDSKYAKVFVLFPLEEVSVRQRKLMTTLGENVVCLAVDGKFDDCQRFVKQAFADKDFKKINLTSANSINIGRLIPQSFYYFWAYFELIRKGFLKEGEELVFSVPSGNFGNVMGGLIAKTIGLPATKFIASTNSNNSFPRFLSTGEYKPLSPSINCLSNAMNIGHPNNIARIVDWLGGGRINEKGEISKKPKTKEIKNVLESYSFSDKETIEVMKNFYKENNSILEPHGAVGWLGIQKYKQENPDFEGISVLLETAHPAKFNESVKSILDIDPEVPNAIKEVENLEEEYQTIPAEYEEFKKVILKNI